ncbi:hypothetical protein VST7929_00072 [Vibrio stylophorae]|uniref:DNA recombination protein RmuC n=1 Tax=Vibrio stylophorae TaxID=659351 RepID=A0ABN8DQL8_9VIBR|nr:hypothetical protein VST7929_00072 [Vibrio stylophorae]
MHFGSLHLLLMVLSSVLVTAAIAGLFSRRRLQQAEAMWQSHHELALAQLQSQCEAQSKELDEMDDARDALYAEQRDNAAMIASLQEKTRQLEVYKPQLEQQQQAYQQLQKQYHQSITLLREQQARQQEQQRSYEEKIALLESAEQRLSLQFEQLANRLFDDKSAQAKNQQQQQLETMLAPFKAQLESFQQRVVEGFGEQTKSRHQLLHHIETLQTLNERMAQDALNLTQALKGDNKQQGNWGEVILGRVLEESGLREGHEYFTQVSLSDAQGKRYQPDVIVKLPQNKDVVIDAKMTLIAYERYYHSEDKAQQERALAEHVAAVRQHIKGLSRKDYHQLHGIETLDYVLMFIPVEPAFQAAIGADPTLLKNAMDNNIMLVSPTTLLVALRTIHHLWRVERQHSNAKEIADRAAKLYDKLRLFVEEMDGMGVALDKAQQHYQGAMNKLASGRGNILSQVQRFQQLGVEVKKPIQSGYLPVDMGDEYQDEQASVGVQPMLNESRPSLAQAADHDAFE